MVSKVEPMDNLILQRELAQFIVADVFNTIGPDDILVQEHGPLAGTAVWLHKGAPLTDGQVAVLKKEALAFSKTSLCRILMDELHYHAREKLESAKSEQDIVAAKLLSYVVKILQLKVKKIADL